ncbi:MAG: hypothetical protein ACM3N4_12145 [Nitrososphaerota archaeon]
MASTIQEPAKTTDVQQSQKQPQKQGKTGIGRRTLFTTAATATICGAGALAAPKLIPILESKAQDMGRTALLNEVGSLEGVSLDAAIRAAELTRIAVKIVVLPLARFVSAVGTGGLSVLLKVLELAHNAMALVHLNTFVLDAFRDVVTRWQDGISALPIALDAYTTADIDSGERYLRALKEMAKHPHIG